MNKTKLTGLVLSTLLLATSINLPALAGEDGPWETDHPAVWHTVSLPLRLVTGAVTGTGGGIVAGAEKVGEAVSDTNEYIVDEDLTPAQLVAVPVAIPVGFVLGSPIGFVDYFKKGYKWWNRF